jgi:hypothetical protein
MYNNVSIFSFITQGVSVGKSAGKRPLGRPRQR